MVGVIWVVMGMTVMHAALAQGISPSVTPTVDTGLGSRPTPTGTLVLSSSVTAIGDSVMLGAVGELRKTIAGINVDAAKSRQMREATRILATRQVSATLGDIVIVHIGNNGPINAKLFDAMMQPLRDIKFVVIVNVKVSRPWEAGNNIVLAEGVKRYPNALLLDWNALISTNMDLLAVDGTHLGAKSAKLYASAVAQVLSEWNAAKPTVFSTSEVGASAATATPQSWSGSQHPR